MDTEKIESLLKLMKEYSVASLEVESEGDRVSISLVAPAGVAAPMLAAPAAMPIAMAAEPAVEGTIIKSPMVGTFYISPKPGEPQFVSVGNRVSQGDVLCIIEAMKLMNEIEAEASGVVKEILVDDAGIVEVGSPLILIG